MVAWTSSAFSPQGYTAHLSLLELSRLTKTWALTPLALLGECGGSQTWALLALRGWRGGTLGPPGPPQAPSQTLREGGTSGQMPTTGGGGS